MSYYVVIRGPLGIGKSTVAARLAQKIKAQHFFIDNLISENNLEKDIEGGYISQKSFIRANELIEPRAREVLKRGRPIVIDGNFYWKSQLDDLKKRLPYPQYVFTLRAPLEVCIARDRERNAPHGEDAARVVYTKSTEFHYGISIDATKPLEETVQEIVSHLLAD